MPDITIYRDSIVKFFRGSTLRAMRLPSAFVLRTVAPAPAAFVGRALQDARRLGKRIVLDFGDAHFAVIHLMIAGRLRRLKPGAALPGRISLCAFDFDDATLLLTEAGTKRRASLHLVEGEAALAAHDPGGLEVFECTREAFVALLRAHDHTLKRTLTDPRLLSGIGNSYSDEILHAARLSPMRRTVHLETAELERLYDATRAVLTTWTERLRAETGDAFPEKVTAFREGMAVHGRYNLPCPDCGAPVQRVVYAENEMNYCARCQNEGRLLADRALSKLLKKDWPRTLDALEAKRGR